MLATKTNESRWQKYQTIDLYKRIISPRWRKSAFSHITHFIHGQNESRAGISDEERKSYVNFKCTHLLSVYLADTVLINIHKTI